MCSVGDGFNIELSDDTDICEYKCKECGHTFKGLGIGNIKCPECHSTDTIKDKE